MCFSPQADLVGGVVVSAIGLDAIRCARKRQGVIALAALPLIFGVHQLIEAMVWLGLQGHAPHQLERIALWAYLLIAFVILPIYVPLAVRHNEPLQRRRRAMVVPAIVGVAVAGDLLASMVRAPINVKLRPYHLAYSIDLSHGGVVVALYVLAVCGSLLLSSRRRVVTFGIVNLVAVCVIAWLTVDGFASVWCGWAAISSGAISLHIRIERVHHRAPPIAVSAA